LQGLWVVAHISAEFREALRLAEESHREAAREADALALQRSDRMAGLTLRCVDAVQKCTLVDANSGIVALHNYGAFLRDQSRFNEAEETVPSSFCERGLTQILVDHCQRFQ